jgi:uncharacterized protein (UPF0305 family)
MKSKELFKEIKNKLANLKIRKPSKLDKNDFISQLSFYNYNLYTEISNKNIEDIEVKEINEIKLDDLKFRIDFYFKKYPTYDNDFEDYVKYITIYLCFFKKKPFHPPGMKTNNKIAILEFNDKYYCNLKKQYENDENSLCKLCISHKT